MSGITFGCLHQTQVRLYLLPPEGWFDGTTCMVRPFMPLGSKTLCLVYDIHSISVLLYSRTTVQTNPYLSAIHNNIRASSLLYIRTRIDSN